MSNGKESAPCPNKPVLLLSLKTVNANVSEELKITN